MSLKKKSEYRKGNCRVAVGAGFAIVANLEANDIISSFCGNCIAGKNK